jgi:mannan endo-1,4-beta-mannosidase
MRETKNILKKSLPVMLGATVMFTALPAIGSMDTVFEGMPCAVSSVAEAAAKTWDFSQDIGAWSYGGSWDYSGKAAASYDPAFGGALKLDVDFSADKAKTWSEVKLSDGAITKTKPLAAKGAQSLSFDLYYDASQFTGSSALKVKVYAKSVKDEEVINQALDKIGMDKAEAVDGSNLKVVHVKVAFDDPVDADIAHLEVSAVSYLSGYKGALYINNMKME